MIGELEQRAVAFVRTIAGQCNECVRRNELTCERCLSRWANQIMSESRPAEKEIPDYSLSARKARIMAALKSAGRPLFTREIDTSELCSKGLKQWTLRQMSANGMIRRDSIETSRGKRYRYSVPHTQTKEHDNGYTNPQSGGHSAAEK